MAGPRLDLDARVRSWLDSTLANASGGALAHTSTAGSRRALDRRRPLKRRRVGPVDGTTGSMTPQPLPRPQARRTSPRRRPIQQAAPLTTAAEDVPPAATETDVVGAEDPEDPDMRTPPSLPRSPSPVSSSAPTTLTSRTRSKRPASPVSLPREDSSAAAALSLRVNPLTATALQITSSIRLDPPSSVHSRQRSPSLPAKGRQKWTRSQLKYLPKPVQFVIQHPRTILPDSTRRLWDALRRIELGHAILPAGLSKRMCGLLEEDGVDEHMWGRAFVLWAEDDDDDDDDDDESDVGNNKNNNNVDNEHVSSNQSLVRDEFRRLKSLVRTSREVASQSLSEADWNERVHRPVLEAALAHRPCSAVVAVNVTQARICPQFRPSLDPAVRFGTGPSADDLAETTSQVFAGGGGGGGGSAHKMVDYAMVLQTEKCRCRRNSDNISDPAPSLHHKIQTLLRRLRAVGDGTATINQFSYEPLQCSPIGCSIETKAGSGTTDAADTQLGIWTSAAHVRWEMLMSLGRAAAGSDRTRVTEVCPLPLIRVHCGTWTCVIAVEGDKGSSINIPVTALKLGDSMSLVGLYQLLASIRCLADWMEHDFRSWVEAVVDSTGIA